MAYEFLNAYGSVTLAESSVVLGGAQRQVVAIGSVLAPIPIIGSGASSVSGTVGASIVGLVPVQTSNTSVITVLQNSSIVAVATGSVTALQGTTPWVISSVYGNVSGSVVAFQGTTPWDIAGSVAAFQAGTRVTSISGTLTISAIQSGASIVGTYQEDAAHSTGERGLFTLAVRNDDLSSVTGSDREYSGITVGPSGEVIGANAPITKWIRGTADLRVVLGASVTAIAAQGASVFTYITSAQVANFGPSSVIVTFAGGLGSTLGYTIAPAGGGSNIYYPNALKTGENSAFTASISGTASVLVSVQGFTARI